MPETDFTLIDFLSHMTALDLLLTALWAGTVLWGLLTGVIRQAFVLGALLAGMVFGAAITPTSSRFAATVSGMDPSDVTPTVYTFVVVAAAVLVYTASLRSYPYTRLVRFPAADAIGGGFVGFTVGLIGVAEIVAALRLLTTQPWAILDGVRADINLQLTSTPFLPWLFSAFPQVAAAVASLLPT